MTTNRKPTRGDVEQVNKTAATTGSDLGVLKKTLKSGTEMIRKVANTIVEQVNKMANKQSLRNEQLKKPEAEVKQQVTPTEPKNRSPRI